jgi:hypothetical protein
VYAKVHANGIPYFKLGKYPRFRLSEVEQWLQESAHGPRKASRAVRKSLDGGRQAVEGK